MAVFTLTLRRPGAVVVQDPQGRHGRRGRHRMTDRASAAASRQATAEVAIDPLLVGEVHQDAAFIGVKGVTGPAGIMYRCIG